MSKHRINHAEIRAARYRAGYTSQIELARKIPCNKNTLSLAENGKCSEKMARRIAAVLGLPDNAFFLDRVPSTEDMSEDQRQIVRVLLEMSTEGVRWLLATVTAMRATPQFWLRRGQGR